ncbi:MAG: protoporphyrinogen oxidase [Candidatus Zixiibacteriota bacterium]
MTKIGVVGGGVAGLSTAFFLAQSEVVKNRGVEIVLLEKKETAGGPIGTDFEDGFQIERGPQGFLDNSAPTLRLVEALGLTDRLVRAAPESQKRYLYKSGTLFPVPTTPPAFLASSLLSPGGRLRVAAEYFVPPKKSNGEESIFTFASRRIGHEAASVLVDALTLGVFAGKAEELSLSACFPKMAEMERQYGGLLKAALKKKGASPFGPRGTLTNFQGGLAELVKTLETKLGPIVKKGVEVRKILYEADNYLLSVKCPTGEETLRFERLILATPSYQAAPLVQEVSPKLSSLLFQIRFAPVAVTVTAFRKDQLGVPLDGFGFLVPRRESRLILGSIWSSAIFPHCAPGGSVILRTFLGGTIRPELVGQSDLELLSLVTGQLSPLLNVRGAPLLTKLYRYPRALPQYQLGHLELLKRIEARLADFPGLSLTGSSYFGAGINDCIREAERIAQSVIQSVG